MTPLNIAKGVLVAVGVSLFFLGIRSGQDLLRYSGIALVVVAWLFRFVPRSASLTSSSRSLSRTSSRTSSEDPQ